MSWINNITTNVNVSIISNMSHLDVQPSVSLALLESDLHPNGSFQMISYLNLSIFNLVIQANYHVFITYWVSTSLDAMSVFLVCNICVFRLTFADACAYYVVILPGLWWFMTVN